MIKASNISFNKRRDARCHPLHETKIWNLKRFCPESWRRKKKFPTQIECKHTKYQIIPPLLTSQPQLKLAGSIRVGCFIIQLNLNIWHCSHRDFTPKTISKGMRIDLQDSLRTTISIGSLLILIDNLQPTADVMRLAGLASFCQNMEITGFLHGKKRPGKITFCHLYRQISF